VTLAVTIVISAVVSLTLTPMMTARIVRHKPNEQQGRFFRASERVFESMIAFMGGRSSSSSSTKDSHFQSP
jgi:multidrug efflux pump